jgi:hypothetical protein
MDHRTRSLHQPRHQDILERWTDPIQAIEDREGDKLQWYSEFPVNAIVDLRHQGF